MKKTKPKNHCQGVCAYLEDPERAEMEETESDDADADEAVPEGQGGFGTWWVLLAPKVLGGKEKTHDRGGSFELGVAQKR